MVDCKMWRVKGGSHLLVWLVASCLSVAVGQPVSCKVKDQCSDGYYCEEYSFVCRECLSCHDLKRDPPLNTTDCIKSVAECGPCYKGLVVDQHGDVNAECVAPDTSQYAPSTPAYLWPLIGIVLLGFLALVIFIVVYLCRHDEIFKPVGSTPSVTAVIASAPEAPPPYNPLPYAPLRTESPYPAPPYTDVAETTYIEEDDRPFIKPRPPRPDDARETAGSQAARVYNRPIYEREPPSPSPESPQDELSEHTVSPSQDDETVASVWTPTDTSNCSNTDGNANGVVAVAGNTLPALLAAARDSTLLDTTPAKRKCVREDSNNNRNRENQTSSGYSQASFGRAPSPSQGPPFNFIAQITNVVQIHKGN